jgi:hypothetical protein
MVTSNEGSGRDEGLRTCYGVRRVSRGAVVVGVAAFAAAVAASTSSGRPVAAGKDRAAASAPITITVPAHSRSIRRPGLQGGHTYKWVVSGTDSYWPVGTGEYPKNVEGQGVDALYCYAAWRCPKPELWRALQVNGDGIDQLAGKVLPPTASHRYEFVGTQFVPVGAVSFEAGGLSGGFTITITEVGAAEQECAKKAVVTFSVDASDVGEIPGESATLVNTRIVGHGSVTFCRTASGKLTSSATGLIGHRDTHKLGPLLREERIALKVVTGAYAASKDGDQRFALAVDVVKSNDRDCHVGAKGLVVLYEERVPKSRGITVLENTVKTAFCGLTHRHTYSGLPSQTKVRIAFSGSV